MAYLRLQIDAEPRTVYGNGKKRRVWDAKWGDLRTEGHSSLKDAVAEIREQIKFVTSNPSYVLNNGHGTWLLEARGNGWQYRTPSGSWTCLGRDLSRAEAIERMYEHSRTY